MERGMANRRHRRGGHVYPTLTKTGLMAGQACDLRAYRSLVRGERGVSAPPPVSEMLVGYRAKHAAIADIHRLWLRRGIPAPTALEEVWASSWRRSGGTGEPDPEGLYWLRDYVETNPFLGPCSGRRLLAVEQTLRTDYLGRTWQARPDVLVEETEDRAVVALEFSSARHPTLDQRAVEVMAAIDGLVLRGPTLPSALCARPHRVVVCGLATGRETDVTLPWPAEDATLRGIDAWLAALANGDIEASPSADVCGRCQYRGDCPNAWGAEQIIRVSPTGRPGTGAGSIVVARGDGERRAGDVAV